MKPADHSSFLRAFLRLLAPALAALPSLASATVQTTHWYRMGEGDPPATVGSSLTTLHDSTGSADLDAAALPPTTSDATLTASSTGVTSTRCLLAPATGFYASGPLLSTDTGDFGFEIWIRPTAVNGTRCIAANGVPGVNGWALSIIDGKLVARCGTKTLTGNTVYTNAWLHVSLVRTAGTTTLTGDVSQFSLSTRVQSSAAIVPPTGSFSLGGTPGTTGPTDLFAGSMDEARSFKVIANFNSDYDLLPSAPQFVAHISAPFATLVNGGTRDLGSLGTGASKSQAVISSPVFNGSFTSAPLEVYGASLSGPDAGEFAILYPTASSSVQRTIATIQFAFRPITPGPKSATLTLLSNDPDDSPFIVHLTATAVAAPNITLHAGADPVTAPKLVDNSGLQTFPLTAPGSASSAERTFAIRNPGLADLHLHAIAMAGSDASAFTVTRPPAATTLAPGESTTFTVNFTPTAPGARNALVIINSDAAERPRFHIPVSATASGPVLQLAGPAGNPLASRAVTAWGYNLSHQCDVPAGLSDVTAVTAGDSFTAALRSDGTVAIWGANSANVLDLPSGLSGITAISASNAHLLALKSDGTVAAWGNNGNNQSSVPAGLTGVTAIAAGVSHSVALKNDGTVTAWGDPTLSAVPSGLTGVVAISAGAFQTLALKNDGTVVAWGSTPTYASSVPAGLDHVVAIASGSSPGLALKDDGSLVSWDLTDDPAGSPFPATSAAITSIAANASLQAAIRGDGSIALTSDSNNYGELSPPPGLRHVNSIAAGTGHFVAVYNSLVDFGALDPAHPGAPQTFTVTNSGAADLHLDTATLTGPGAACYTLNAGSLATLLPPGQSTTLTVACTAQAGVSTDASLRLSSDDPGHPVFTVRLTGAAFSVTPYLDAWRFQHFATTANSGDAADDADPNHNGIPNLLEYVLGGDPAGATTPASALLPTCSFTSSTGRPLFQFTRINEAVDVDLTIQGSSTLQDGSWQDLAHSTGGGVFSSLVTGVAVSETIYADTRSVRLTDALPPHHFFRLRATRH